MKLDLVNIIDKLPYVHKSVEDTPKKKKPKKDAQPKSLGDAERFDDLPDDVDKKFMAAYRESLDKFLIPYIQYGEMTIISANTFIENLIEQIFGNSKHFGIFSYLKERNFDNLSDKELVRSAEKLINNGWRVRKDKNADRYKIVNSDGSNVIDATGKSNLFEEVESSVIDSSSAHLFIDESNASHIETIARSNSLDADDLTSKKNLNAVLRYTDDPRVSGVIYNYNKLLNLLKFEFGYPTSSRGVSFTDLYSNGYTLSEKMIFSNDDRLVMKKGGDDFIIYPVKGEFNYRYGVSKDLLAFVSSKFRSSLFKSLPSVDCQDFVEIKEFGRTVALMSNYWPFDRVNQSYADMVETLKRLDSYKESGEVSEEFYDRIMRSFAISVITDYLVLGNGWFSLSAMGLDTVSGKFYSFSSRDSFSLNPDDFDSFLSKFNRIDSNVNFGMFLDDVYAFSLPKGKIPALLNYLPEDYFSALEKLDIDVDGYPVKLTGVKDYMSKVIDFLVKNVRGR